MNGRAASLGIALAVALGTPAVADRVGPFEKVHCFRYANAPDFPLGALIPGSTEIVELPFAFCAAQRGGQVVVLDAGYVDTEYAKVLGAPPDRWVDFPELLGEVGIDAGAVTHVMISHLHWDHAGGTSRFPNAQFVVQRRELEVAVLDFPENRFASEHFRAEDVLDAVRLKWEGRLELADGDVEGYLPGVDLYLTPGHTAGTMTVCLATRNGRVCYASDAAPTWANLERDLPLGIAYSNALAYESFEKIRKVLRGGKLIPGHEPGLFSDPKARGYRKVSSNVVTLVE